MECDSKQNVAQTHFEGDNIVNLIKECS